jgi:uncharacterized protein Yka (UPF0111/DUF47 family)
MSLILTLLDTHASRTHAATSLLATWTSGAAKNDEALSEIENAERVTEEALDEIERRLLGSMFERVDRDDLHSIATALDSVLRLSTRAARHVLTHAIDRNARVELASLTSLAERATASIASAVTALANEAYAEVLEHARMVQATRREAREIHQAAVASLVAEDRPPVSFFIAKDALDGLDRLLERTSLVATRLTHVAIKNH